MFEFIKADAWKMLSKMINKGLSLVVLLVALPWTASAEGDITASIQDGWILASRGSDESLQSVHIQIWGSSRISGQFHQLDDDPEREYVVSSRGSGSGPYYKLQIIDFLPDGILTWSYDSAGAPRIEDGFVYLGELVGGYAGAATAPSFRKYRFSGNGLSEVKGP